MLPLQFFSRSREITVTGIALYEIKPGANNGAGLAIMRGNGIGIIPKPAHGIGDAAYFNLKAGKVPNGNIFCVDATWLSAK